MTSTRTHNILSAAALAGGAAWLVKFAVIAAVDPDAGATAFFYILGVTLMAVGSIAIGMRLTAGRGNVAKVIAAVASPVAFFAAYLVLDGISKPLVGDSGPFWLAEEAGIALTGFVYLLVGAAMLRGREG